jgi:N-acetylglucosaminyl-diphospho-decaprenol L-rhamnosyltransferase
MTSVPSTAGFSYDRDDPRSGLPRIDGPTRPLDIAVIIVTYKCANLTIECLRSLVAERVTLELRVRVIVVDNASGDLPQLSQEVEAHDWSSWVTLVAAPTNGGFAYGNNLGIETAYAKATPDYVYLLNPDTQVRPGAILSLVNFLQTHSEAGIAGGIFENPDGSDDAIAFRFPNLISEVEHGLAFGLISRLLKPWMTVRRMTGRNEPVDWICGASMLIRPEVFAAIGGLDENYFLYFEETDFCWRAKRAGFATWYMAESRVMHIGGKISSATDLSGRPKRLPAYWFESRRRYFVVTFGIVRAMTIDLAAVAAHLLGSLKRMLQFRRHKAVPYYVRDLLRYSVLRRQNRDTPAPRSRIIARHSVAGGDY